MFLSPTEKFGEVVQRPARPSFRQAATGEGYEVSFRPAVKFRFIDPVGLAAIHRRQAVLGVPLPDAANRSGMTADGLTDLLVSQAVIRVQ
jgi:hypothetical protein